MVSPRLSSVANDHVGMQGRCCNRLQLSSDFLGEKVTMRLEVSALLHRWFAEPPARISAAGTGANAQVVVAEGPIAAYHPGQPPGLGLATSKIPAAPSALRFLHSHILPLRRIVPAGEDRANGKTYAARRATCGTRPSFVANASHSSASGMTLPACRSISFSVKLST